MRVRTHTAFLLEWRYFPRKPKGWELMAYERNGKMVCRYFYTDTERND